VLDLPLPGWPGQRERLPRDTEHPCITVCLDDVMAFQPGLINNMRPGRDRPPPARKIALSPVGSRLSERPHMSEINGVRLIEKNDASEAVVIHVHELDAIGQDH
jgi:hypothetical protein